MSRNIFLTISALTPNEIGQWTGRLLASMALAAGVWKCFSIARRPTTSAKCLVSLALVLTAWLFLNFGLAAKDLVADPLGARLIAVFDGLVVLLFSLASFILAIIGLVDCRGKRDVFRQGRAQAIWALVISAFIGLCLTAGFVKGVIDSGGLPGQTANLFPTAAPATKKVLAFDDRNFRFHAPGRPWVSLKPSLINKDSQLVFTRSAPQVYFLVIAEDLGGSTITNTQEYVELAKARTQASTTSDAVLREAPMSIGNLRGIGVTHTAQVKNLSLYFEQWFCVTNGWGFQLTGWGRSTDEKLITAQLSPMFRNFEMIDPNRIASSGQPFSTNFVSQRYAYEARVAGTQWRRFATLDKNFPQAEFGASIGDSCFAVVPVWLRNQNIEADALNAALLSTMNIEYPDENLTARRSVKEGAVEGDQFVFTRELKGVNFRYAIKLLKSRGCAYVVAAWTQRRQADADAILRDALERVIFSPAGASLSADVPFSSKELNTQAAILNQAGLSYFNGEQYEKALPLFRAALDVNKTIPDTAYLKNLLLCWSRLGRSKEGLDFLQAQPASIQAIPDLRSFLAYFQSKSSQTDQAVSNYAAIFSAGYRDDSDFKDYIDLLVQERHYDRALSEVAKYLQGNNSIDIRLLSATIYREQKDFARAVEFLKSEHKADPLNARITKLLGEAYLDANLPAEALACSKELLTDDPKSAPYYYLKGRGELQLKRYRDAKASLEQASKLSPSSEDIRSDLAYVSGLLGQGNNSMLKDPIAPVEFPPALTNASSDLPPNGAKGYGAYYSRLITAVAYTPHKDYKTTDYYWIRVLDSTGVGIFSTVQFSFDPLAEDIYVNEVSVMDAAGRVVSIGKVDDYYAVDDNLSTTANHKKTLNIPIAGLQPGNLIFVAVTRRQSGKLDGFPFLQHSFSHGFPVAESMLFLQGDTNGLAVRSSAGVTARTFPQGHSWRVAEPLVDRWEPLQPMDKSSYLPTLWIADAADTWPGLSSNYLASIADKLQTDDSFRSRARNLVVNLTNGASKTTALSRFVQTNCTYKAIEFGRRGRIPNRPAEILENKYGDCKDHAVLLQQLLAAVGVPANLALIGKPSILKDLPSIDQFNHVIVYVPGDAGGAFIDCTDKGANLADPVPAHLAGYEALVLDDRSPRIARIPVLSDDDSLIDVHQRARLTNDSDLIVDEDMEFTGPHAVFLRDFLLACPATYQQTAMQRGMGMDDVEITNFRVDSLDEPRQVLRLHFTFTGKGRFHTASERVSGNLRAGFERDYLVAAPVERRVSPFELRYALVLRTSISFDVPSGWRAEPLQVVSAELDSRFASCKTHIRQQDTRLEYDVECRRRTGQFSPADYSNYRQTMTRALSAFEPQISLKKL